MWVRIVCVAVRTLQHTCYSRIIWFLSNTESNTGVRSVDSIHNGWLVCAVRTRACVRVCVRAFASDELRQCRRRWSYTVRCAHAIHLLRCTNMQWTHELVNCFVRMKKKKHIVGAINRRWMRQEKTVISFVIQLCWFFYLLCVDFGRWFHFDFLHFFVKSFPHFVLHDVAGIYVLIHTDLVSQKITTIKAAKTKAHTHTRFVYVPFDRFIFGLCSVADTLGILFDTLFIWRLLNIRRA